MPPSPLRTRSAPHLQGFTLLEVLMVVAVISILVAIIIPAIGGAQNSARRAKTRVQFSQWSAAIEQFRQEYGYYPVFTNFRVNDGAAAALSGEHIFHDTLSARRRNGEALPTGSGSTATAPERQNPKRIQFCTFGSDELNSGGQIQDAFGNMHLGVLLDLNLSGAITFGSANADYPTITTPITSIQIGDSTSTLPIAITSDTVIRAGVAFYSAGDGQRPVTSW